MRFLIALSFLESIFSRVVSLLSPCLPRLTVFICFPSLHFRLFFMKVKVECFSSSWLGPIFDLANPLSPLFIPVYKCSFMNIVMNLYPRKFPEFGHIVQFFPRELPWGISLWTKLEPSYLHIVKLIYWHVVVVKESPAFIAGAKKGVQGS